MTTTPPDRPDPDVPPVEPVPAPVPADPTDPGTQDPVDVPTPENRP